MITDQETDRKAGIANPYLRAQHALVDPALTYALPPAPTMYGGVDALAQALAATVIRASTPIGDAIGLEAVRLAGEALPAVLRDGADTAARSRMMCASMMAGLAMNISDCGSEHPIAQAIGGRFHLPHGLTIGLVLAETMDFDRRAVPARFERVADALGEPDDGSGDGSRAVRGVQPNPGRDRLPDTALGRRLRGRSRCPRRRGARGLLHYRRARAVDEGRRRRLPASRARLRAPITSQASLSGRAPSSADNRPGG